MATTKPTKPTNLMPRHFADDGIKNNFSSAKISNGFSSNFKDIVQGDNLNYMLDSIGKELEYLSTVVDFIVDTPINKVIGVNSNNKLDYVNNTDSNKANVNLDNLTTAGNNKVLPSQIGNNGKFLTTNGTSPSWTSVDIANRSLSNLTSAGEARLTEGKRNIGEIITSTLPLTDAGLHLLDGALIQGSGSYSAFVTFIASLVSKYPNIFTTENNWQNTISQYGVCGKFVYNSTNNTVRLPKITGIISGISNNSELGGVIEAGLPNITGTISLQNQSFGSAVFDGAFSSISWSRTNNSGDGGTGSGLRKVAFDASSSNPIYGISTTVQPQATKVFYYIVIANSSKLDIQVDIDNIATDVENKADKDLSNVPESKGILVEKSDPSIMPRWYRVYADGWCEQGGISPSAGDKTNNTITLLRSYKDTNYSILYAQNAGVEDAYTNGCTAKDKTTSSFVLVYRTGGTASFYWQASGYIR